MPMEFIVETINKEIINPSSPTPLSHKNFQLSFLDQIVPPVNLPFIFWYPNYHSRVDVVAKIEARNQQLKKSLSETLTRFYPFAGRFSRNNDNLIECNNNDQGVVYIETRVDCLLKDILEQPGGADDESMRKLLPLQMRFSEEGQILLAQVNVFKCGGMAIGLSLSHKVADLFTLVLFIKTWAAMTKGILSHEVIPFPDLESISSSFPPLDLHVPEMDWTGSNEGVSRRIVFDSSKISMLKAEAASKEVPQPTRVEAVTALLWKSAMAAAASSRGGLKKQSALLQWVNLRKRMNPPMPEFSTGNLISCFAAKTSLDWETELQGLVKQLRKGMREFSGDFLPEIQESNINAVSAMHEYVNEVESLSKDDEVDVYNCSSWCRMEVYESADFGWGKPRWVSGLYKLITPPNSFLLMESTDGEGIEAWVYLSEPEMAFFECNRDLLAFASVNPSVKL